MRWSGEEYYFSGVRSRTPLSASLTSSFVSTLRGTGGPIDLRRIVYLRDEV